MPTRNDGSEYTKLEQDEAELLAWGPSLRAMRDHDGTYEDYLRLMAEYTKELTDKVNDAFF